jgi:fatty-acyl-CoA synthase
VRRRWPSANGALQFDDPINIQYTSGTTGRPKGATLSHHNILNNAGFTGRALRYTQNDRVCIPVPFYHCFGMVLGVLCCVAHGRVHGRAERIIRPARGPGDGARGTVYFALWRADDVHRGVGGRGFDQFDLRSLRTGIMAGAPCPRGTHENGSDGKCTCRKSPSRVA